MSEELFKVGELVTFHNSDKAVTDCGYNHHCCVGPFKIREVEPAPALPVAPNIYHLDGDLGDDQLNRTILRGVSDAFDGHPQLLTIETADGKLVGIYSGKFFKRA